MYVNFFATEASWSLLEDPGASGVSWKLMEVPGASRSLLESFLEPPGASTILAESILKATKMTKTD